MNSSTPGLERHEPSGLGEPSGPRAHRAPRVRRGRVQGRLQNGGGQGIATWRERSDRYEVGAPGLTTNGTRTLLPGIYPSDFEHWRPGYTGSPQGQVLRASNEARAPSSAPQVHVQTLSRGGAYLRVNSGVLKKASEDHRGSTTFG